MVIPGIAWSYPRHAVAVSHIIAGHRFTPCLKAVGGLPVQAKSKARELWYLSAADAYFDDQEHFNEIRYAKVQACYRAACTGAVRYSVSVCLAACNHPAADVSSQLEPPEAN